MSPFVDIPAVVELYMNGRLPLDRLVSATYELDDLGKAFTAMEDGSLEGRSVVVFS